MKKFTALSFFLILSMILKAQTPAWRFIKETKGIKVYYREIPNQNLNEVKIQTTFNCNLSTIVEALRDVKSYPEWVYKVVSSKTVKEITSSEVLYYNKLNFPWPLADRDVVIHTKIIQNPVTKEVNSISYAEPGALPQTTDMIRIKEFNSKWSFIPKEGYVVGEYIFRSNPGGNIPLWMVNLSLDEGPVKTIQNFKRILLENQYSKYNELAILN